MSQKSTFRNTVIYVVFLVAIGFALIIAVTYFRVMDTGNLSSTQDHASATKRSDYPGPDDPTVAAIVTNKAIMEATYLATTRTPSDTQVPFPTGTFEGEMAKFTAEKLFLVGLNAWRGYQDGFSVGVYAGSLPEDSEQGAIVVVSHEPHRLFEEKVLTPTKHGGVHVIAEQNNRLTLMAADGEIFYFDVPARRFVDTLTTVVSSATLLPTSTPYVPGQSTPMPAVYPYPLSSRLTTQSP